MPRNHCRCPCNSLQSCVKAAAVFEAVTNFSPVVFLSLNLAYMNQITGGDLFSNEPIKSAAILDVVYLIIFSLDFLLAIVLYLGAHLKSIWACRTWLGFTAITTLMFISIHVFEVYQTRSGLIVLGYVRFVIQSSTMFFVDAFIDECCQQRRVQPRSTNMELGISTTATRCSAPPPLHLHRPIPDRVLPSLQQTEPLVQLPIVVGGKVREG